VFPSRYCNSSADIHTLVYEQSEEAAAHRGEGSPSPNGYIPFPPSESYARIDEFDGEFNEISPNLRSPSGEDDTSVSGAHSTREDVSELDKEGTEGASNLSSPALNTGGIDTPSPGLNPEGLDDPQSPEQAETLDIAPIDSNQPASSTSGDTTDTSDIPKVRYDSRTFGRKYAFISGRHNPKKCENCENNPGQECREQIGAKTTAKACSACREKRIGCSLAKQSVRTSTGCTTRLRGRNPSGDPEGGCESSWK
jgi:hypothetical protein